MKLFKIFKKMKNLKDNESNKKKIKDKLIVLIQIKNY